MDQTVRIVNLTFQVSGALICMLTWTALKTISGKERKTDRIYEEMLLVDALMLYFDALAYFSRYWPAGLAFYGVRASTFLHFFFLERVIVLFSYYQKAFVEERIHQSISKNYTRIVNGLMVVHGILLLVNLFVPFGYQIDVNNLYSRLHGFLLFAVIPNLTALVALVMNIRYHKCMQRSEWLALLVVYLIPFGTGVLSMMRYGYVFSQMGLTLGGIIIFMCAQTARANYLAEQENERVKSQMRIAMSQIQPHFLFNALNSIEYLCYTDAAQAGKAVNNLAAFLRENMNSLSQESPIPFSRELEHVKNYLYIEQLRFPHIQIFYDIPVTNFKLPPLSVQPIVENAIKHGLRNKLENAEVHITTEEDKDNYLVRIRDNGIGFDPTKVPEDGKPHVGIANVKQRMQIMCDGDLQIDSDQEGSTVTLRIPKKRKREGK